MIKIRKSPTADTRTCDLHSTSEGESLRPYPEGTAWDEAWFQRQRADKLEKLSLAVVQSAMIGDQNFIACLLRDEEGARLRRRIVDMVDFLRDDTGD